jgi:membrane-bound ClpP family serine protease
MSIGMLIQIAGMFLGDIVGIVTLILTLLMLWEKPAKTNRLVLIPLAGCLVGIVLSTPLGQSGILGTRRAFSLFTPR